MKKRHLDFDELYQLYVIQGMSQIQIAKHFHCGKNTVHDHLVQYKIPMRSQRKYQLREDYFDYVNSQEKAWLLGFLYADGYNNERKGDIKIRLAIQDQEILERIRELLYIGELPNRPDSKRIDQFVESVNRRVVNGEFLSRNEREDYRGPAKRRVRNCMGWRLCQRLRYGT